MLAVLITYYYLFFLSIIALILSMVITTIYKKVKPRAVLTTKTSYFLVGMILVIYLAGLIYVDMITCKGFGNGESCGLNRDFLFLIFFTSPVLVFPLVSMFGGIWLGNQIVKLFKK